ncbi:MAG: zinc dependent phospholipase C family protein [Deltaproteobacteria bacterium]|nr:zinc dependent phospholipase C family protein [Deltaproteobacteria bacterium]
MRLPTWLALALVAALLAPAAARANGAYTHAHISQLAWRALPPGPVRDLLDAVELQRACEQGSLFPDSGYGVSEPYGEFAHWEPFVVAYIDDLRTRYGGDYTSDEARREIAFLLGVASHGMADQSYDTTLLARAFEVDGPEVEGFGVDQYADYFIVVDEDVRFVVEAWAPYSALSSLLERAEGTPISEARLTEAMELVESLTRAQSSPLVADNLYWDAWEHYPWLGTHVYNDVAVGSLPWIATLVGEYWQIIWRRLHDSDDPDEDLVVRTVPSDDRRTGPSRSRTANRSGESASGSDMACGATTRRRDCTCAPPTGRKCPSRIARPTGRASRASSSWCPTLRSPTPRPTASRSRPARRRSPVGRPRGRSFRRSARAATTRTSTTALPCRRRS